MANMHVLTKAGGKTRIVFHVPIPNVNNSRGVNFRTAIVNAGLNNASILPSGNGSDGTIGAAEVTSLSNGSLVEIVEDIKRTAATAQELDALFAIVQAETQARYQAMLSDFGATR